MNISRNAPLRIAISSMGNHRRMYRAILNVLREEVCYGFGAAGLILVRIRGNHFLNGNVKLMKDMEAIKHLIFVRLTN